MSKVAKKIPAYTLTEILVVLTLSTIVATLAFSILTLVNSNLNTIQQNYERSTQLNLLRQQLVIDLNQYHELTYSQFPYELVGRTPLDSVRYSFSEKAILRNQDTLFVGEYTNQIFYNGIITPTEVADAIKLEFGSPVNQTIFVYKEKDAYQKLKGRGN